MQIRSFIIAYALVLAILLFADRRPGSTQQDRYSHVVDLTEGESATAPHRTATGSRTRIIAPGALVPGTWAAGQIPAERLVAPLVVIDLNTAPKAGSQISLDDIETWEGHHGMIPQGAVIAIRQTGTISSVPPEKLPVKTTHNSAIAPTPFPIARDAARFLIDARYTIGFAVETTVDFTSDRNLR